MSFLGGLIGLGTALFSHHSAKKQAEQQKDNQMELNEQQLENQKDLFKYENENKHQFEVADLRAAGLNPILSAGASSAASVGGVSNGQAQSAQPTDFPGAFEKMFSAVSNAEIGKANASAERDKAEAALMQAKAAQTDAQTNSARQKKDALVADSTIALNQKRVSEITANIENSKQITSAQVSSLLASAEASHSVAEYNRTRSVIDSILADSQIDKDKATISQLKDASAKLKKETVLLQGAIDDPESKAHHEYWKENGVLKYGSREMLNSANGAINSANSVMRFGRFLGGK